MTALPVTTLMIPLDSLKSFAKAMSTPIMYQIGIPIAMQHAYFNRIFFDAKSLKKFPRETVFV
jgi:hypothetical protein